LASGNRHHDLTSSARWKGPRESEKQNGVRYSGFPLFGLSLAAVIGTGLFAVFEHSYERPIFGAERAPQEQSEAAPSVTARAVRQEHSSTKRVGVPPDSAAPRDGAQPAPAMNDPAAQKVGEVREPLDAAATPAREESASAVGRVAGEQNSNSSGEPEATGTIASPSSPGAAPADCPLPELTAMLADISARFGSVTVIARHQQTPNHRSGSMREKLHHDCKAVDFRPDRSRVEQIKAYLRTRPAIAGVESYRDGVVHMDLR
jgi:hypothetical protein